MLSVTTEIEINAPAHIVWNILDDLDCYGEWNVVIPSITGRTTLGQKLQAIFSPDGKNQTIKPLIHRVVPLRELHWVTSIPILLKADHGFQITPISEAKCKFVNREDFGGLIPKLAWKKIAPTLQTAYAKMNVALKNRAEDIYKNGYSGSLHPAVDSGIKPVLTDFSGGLLRCHCANHPVELQVNSQSVFSYLSGSRAHWKPKNVLFSFLSMVPNKAVKILHNEAKLKVIESAEHLKQHICTECGVHMLGEITNEQDVFYGLAYVHTELSDVEGWAPPTFAAYVSELVETGIKPQWMSSIRKSLTLHGVAPSDALSPELMDKLAASKMATNKNNV